MTAVMRHLRKHRPEWTIDYQADAGRESAMIGLVRDVYTYQQTPAGDYYDRVIEIKLYDTFAAWTDRPNTRVTSCLHEKFGMGWDRECGGYEINVTRANCHKACVFLDSLGREPERTIDAEYAGLYVGEEYPSEWLKYPVVCIHYQGDSSPQRKNLTHEQANAICNAIIELGRMPLLLDWRGACPLATNKIMTVGRLPQRESWGRSAQMNAAIISQCEAFIGIDSGPGKCASSTNTPALIVWTGHHPALYHDPADNTTHLVPICHQWIEPVNGNKDVVRFFIENYNVRTYLDYHVKTQSDDLVSEVKKWLSEKLK